MTSKVFAACLSAAFVLAGAAQAQVPELVQHPASMASVQSVPSADPATHALDAADLNSWLDGFMPQALTKGDIAGAVVVVVKDGHILTQRGFGVSDMATRAPVDPATTLFRVGSTSKLFTWTSVMQLVQAGKLNLDADINGYLDFKMPPAFGKPITLRNLMTHTAGFEEHAKNLFVPTAVDMQSLAQYVKSWVPARIFPPGTVPSYSNYGAALAGYIVQRVSGEPFDTYVMTHIFQPLGMTHATFDQPLPPGWLPHLSKSYHEASGPAQPFEVIPAAPAGAMSVSGVDMAPFMMAHLNEGQFGSVSILDKATAGLMHAQTFAATPPVPGMALGFYHEDRNGHIIIGHAGDTETFHTDLHLFLNEGTGLFVSFNSLGIGGAADTARTMLFREFTNRYFPLLDKTPKPTLASAKADAAIVSGAYIGSRRSDTTFLHLGYLFSESRISVDADGTVSFGDLLLPGLPPAHWREVAPFVWQKVGGVDLLAAAMQNGRVTAVGIQGAPFEVFQPVTGAFASWNITVLQVSLIILIVAALLWPIMALVRRHYRAPFTLVGMSAVLYHLVRLAAVVDVLLAIGWLTLGTLAGSNVTFLDTSVDPWLRVLQVLGVLGVLGALAGILNLVQVFRSSGGGWWAKVTAFFLAFATVGAAWIIIGQRLVTASLQF